MVRAAFALICLVFFCAGPVRAAESLDCAAAQDAGQDCAPVDVTGIEDTISKTFSSVVAKLPAEDADALKDDQAAFLRGRKLVSGLDADMLPDFLGNRLSFLTAIVPAPQGFAGHWENEFGVADVTPKEGGKFAVVVETTDPVGSRWLCRYVGEGTLKEGKISVIADGDKDDSGWTIRLARQGQRLVVDEVPGVNTPKDDQFPYCGRAGKVAFNYFAAKNLDPNSAPDSETR